MARLGPDPDWTSVIGRHARSAGVDLSSQTVDELATHLEDIYLAARADGDDDEAARVKARQALEASGLLPLRREPRPAPPAPHARPPAAPRPPPPRPTAPPPAAPPGRPRPRSFAMGYALRMALRQFRL